MNRPLTRAEIAKRIAIRAHHDKAPSTTMRELAAAFQTSFRVIYDALSKRVRAWEAMLPPIDHGQYPALLSPAFPPESLVPRDYQASAARAGAARNTLLVLPTGLGKTIVALLHVQAILGSRKAGICVMMAPTKALLVQHRDLFRDHLGMHDVGLAIVDGETTPDDRKAFYADVKHRFDS